LVISTVTILARPDEKRRSALESLEFSLLCVSRYRLGIMGILLQCIRFRKTNRAGPVTDNGWMEYQTLYFAKLLDERREDRPS